MSGSCLWRSASQSSSSVSIKMGIQMGRISGPCVLQDFLTEENQSSDSVKLCSIVKTV